MERKETDIFSRTIVNKDGIVTRWPKKQDERRAVLEYIRSKIDKGRTYTEIEINELIDKWHSFGDCALIRRMMYDFFLIERAEDGINYCVDESGNTYAKALAGLIGRVIRIDILLSPSHSADQVFEDKHPS